MLLSGHTRLGLSEGLDTQVQGTNDDAQISKLSCARAGYFQDEYVHHFVRRPVRRSPLINRGYYSRYAGLKALLNQFLDLTSAAGSASQVVILGAGFDTTWFQLAAAGKTPTRLLELDFKEVTQRKVAIIKQQPDLLNLVRRCHHAHATARPAAAECIGAEDHHVGGQQSQLHVESSNRCQQTAVCPASPIATPAAAEHAFKICGSSAVSSDLHGPSTLLEGCEQHAAISSLQHASERSNQAATPAVMASALRHGATGTQAAGTSAADEVSSVGIHLSAPQGELISSRYSIMPADLRDTQALAAVMQQAGVDCSLPTFLLSECVLVYMEPASSSALLRWASQYFTNAAVVVYEQIKPADAFGRQMMSNLEARGCPLRGLPATPTLEAHCQRLLAAGWQVARAWDMDSVYKWHLDPQDKQRIESLEVFDEFEEWHLIQEHYSISLGSVGPMFVGQQQAGGRTAAAPSQHTDATLQQFAQLGFGPQGMVSASQSSQN